MFNVLISAIHLTPKMIAYAPGEITFILLENCLLDICHCTRSTEVAHCNYVAMATVVPECKVWFSAFVFSSPYEINL